MLCDIELPVIPLMSELVDAVTNEPEFVLLSQGAEGKVYDSHYLGRPSIIKERISKSYRVAELDVKLTKQRLIQEAKCMVRCRRAGVITPTIYLVDPTAGHLHMEKILGKTIKQFVSEFYTETGI